MRKFDMASRSFLFVPGNKDSWIEKALKADADVLILDLEDSVPAAEKETARKIVAARLPWLAEQKQRTYVRINKSPYLYDFEDILAVVGPHLEGVVISKPAGPEDLEVACALISEAEYRNGVAHGTTMVIPLLETARSLQFAHEIALNARVPAIVGATAKNADVARALNTVWTEGGRETLYLKSRVVMAARAAGKLPIGGLWQQVHDLDGLRRSAAENRELGMSGELVLHPSNVQTVNQVYSPSAEDLKFYEGLVAAVEAAQRQGRASTIYDGEHVDIAHAKTAREILEQAKAFSR